PAEVEGLDPPQPAQAREAGVADLGPTQVEPLERSQFADRAKIGVRDGASAHQEALELGKPLKALEPRLRDMRFSVEDDTSDVSRTRFAELDSPARLRDGVDRRPLDGIGATDEPRG